MFLVDDDKPEVVERREDRRAGTDAYAGLAAAQTLPFVAALAVAEPRVQNRDSVAEPPGNAGRPSAG